MATKNETYVLIRVSKPEFYIADDVECNDNLENAFHIHDFETAQNECGIVNSTWSDDGEFMVVRLA